METAGSEKAEFAALLMLAAGSRRGFGHPRSRLISAFDVPFMTMSRVCLVESQSYGYK